MISSCPVLTCVSVRRPVPIVWYTRASRPRVSTTLICCGGIGPARACWCCRERTGLVASTVGVVALQRRWTDGSACRAGA
jgi:hypothetical protein